jgi:hypothetical protein
VNAYQQLQSSGIHWPDHTPALLYQPVQAPPQLPEPRQRGAIFEGREKQMAEFAAQHEAVLNDVRKHYVFPADSSVSNFLTEHRGIPQILLGAVLHLRACFGADAVFDLRAPVDEAGSRTLYVVTMWPGKSQDVRDALAKFDNDWWMARAGQAAGYLTFTYELV